MPIFLQETPQSPEEPTCTLGEPLLKHTPLHNEGKSFAETRRLSNKYYSKAQLDENLASFYPCPCPDYFPKKTPPDFQEAEEHRIAHKIHPFCLEKSGVPVCKSTGLAINKKQISLGCDISELFHLGPVIPMYFLYVKQCGFIMFIFGFFTFLMAISEASSVSSFYEDFLDALLDNGTFVSMLTSFVLVMVICLLPALHLFRRQQKLTKLACKKTVLTPADYTIMCSSMGRIHVESEVQKFFSERVVPEYSLDVAQVSITYNIEKYVDKIRMLKKVLDARKGLGEGEDEKSALEQKIEESNRFFNENKHKLERCSGLKKNGVAFVTFSTKQEAKVVRRRFERSSFERLCVQVIHHLTEDFTEYFFKQNFITVEKAPTLDEIIWENLNCDRRKLFSGFAFVLMFFIVSLNSMVACYINQTRHSPYILGLSTAITNELLAFIALQMALREKFKSITETIIALGTGVVIFQFINSAVPILLAYWVIPKISVEEFSQDLFAISIVIFLAPSLGRLLNPKVILKSIQRRILLAQGPRCTLSQEQVNHIFEDRSISVYRLYSDCTLVLLFSCLYFTVSPGISLVAFIAFIAIYWSQKYDILRRTLLPPNIRSEIAEAMFEFADIAVFLLALGCYCFLAFGWPEDIEDRSNILLMSSFLVLLAAGVNMILPNRRLNRNWFPKKKVDPRHWVGELLYQQASEYFFDNYFTVNPVYRDKLLPKYAQEFHAKISEEFKCIEILKTLPELLPLFEYAVNRPSLYQIWEGGLEGLKDPYYSFPQNYGYGVEYFCSNLGQATRIMTTKQSSAVKKSIGTFDCEEAKEPQKKLTLEEILGTFRRPSKNILAKEFGGLVEQNIDDSSIFAGSPPLDALPFVHKNSISEVRLDQIPSELSIIKDSVLETKSFAIEMSSLSKLP